MAIGVVAVYSFIISLVIFKIIDVVIGVRVCEECEENGLDIEQHGEAGYFL